MVDLSMDFCMFTKCITIDSPTTPPLKKIFPNNDLVNHQNPAHSQPPIFSWGMEEYLKISQVYYIAIVYIYDI
jgi:hypothetical protein